MAVRLNFFRSYPFQTELQVAKHGKEGRFFILKVGVTGPVDPESGMMIDLGHLDQAVARLLGSSAGKVTSEIDFLLTLLQELKKWNSGVVFLELEEPSSGKAWISDAGVVRRKDQNWIQLTKEQKVFKLSVLSAEGVQVQRSKFTDLEDLSSELSTKMSGVLAYQLEDPVSKVTRTFPSTISF